MDMLDRIVAKKREELANLQPVSQGNIRPSNRDLGHFIATQKQEIAIIAEIKRATPFKGPLLSQPVEAKAWAKLYEEAGAAAISVLTDETFFQGKLADLEEASQGTVLPILRKDFILDERQILEARLHGADAVLLIARLLAVDTLRHFLSVCQQLHMRALVEVHDAGEIETALAAGARIIGINNRNLADGVTDLQVTLKLAPLVPKEFILVSESGIERPEDLQCLRGIVDAVLVGTSIMKAADPAAQLRDLVEAGAH